jgi:hypothetical protein
MNGGPLRWVGVNQVDQHPAAVWVYFDDPGPPHCVQD